MSARRARGDGGLTQRHDHASCPAKPKRGKRPEHKCRGRWQGSLPVMPGSSKKKYVYGATKAEAKAKLDKARTERDAGTLVLTEITVEAWLRHWLEHISEVRPQTWRGYKSKIETYLVPHLGHHRLTGLRPEHVRLMYRQMREAGLSESSLRQTHAILARALRVAMQEGKIVRNPLEAVKPPGTKTKRREQLTMVQARQVLDHTDDARWWLALYYGMRQGEVLGLRWCDVHLDEPIPYIDIVQTLQRDRAGKLTFGPTKSEAGERRVPLVPVMAARLRLARAEWMHAELLPDALVFPDKDGGPRKPTADWRAWRQLLEEAGTTADGEDLRLPVVALHSARNTAASLLEAAGVPTRLVGQIIGHANIAQTEHYQHAEQARMLDALQAGVDRLGLRELD